MKFCTTSSIDIFHPNFSRSAWELGNWFVLKPGFHPSSATLSSYTIKLKTKSRAFLCYLCAVVHKSIQAKTKTADLNCRLVDVLSHFLLLPCLPRGSFCLQHPADLTALRHWCWEPRHLLQRMLPHCSHACYNHTGRDCLCLQFPSPKPFTISWNWFWFGPWLFPSLFLWCFMFFLLTHTQACTNQ